jgi:hypothetical protein
MDDNKEKPSCMENYQVMTAMGGLWGGRVAIEGKNFSVTHPDSDVRKWIWRMSEYCPDKDKKWYLHCESREKRGLTLSFFNVDEISYLWMGANKQMTIWMANSKGRRAESFMKGFNAPYVRNLSDKQQEMVDTLILNQNKMED